jgi:hypothetical protein
MRTHLALACALLASVAASGAEVPPELRGRISVEVTSCEPFQAGESTRVVLVRVRAGARGVKEPEIRCGAVGTGSDAVVAWARVRGIEELAAREVREAMVLVPADAEHDECRCVVRDPREDALCAPWESLENGRCVEPGEVAADAPAPPAPADELAAALRVSRALTPLRALLEPGRTAEGRTSGICAAVLPASLGELVAALVPEDGTVYVRPLWHRLDAADQKAFAIWASECFGIARIVDAERGVELTLAPQEDPP